MVPVNLLGFFVFLPPLFHGGCEFLFRDFAVAILISSGKAGMSPGVELLLGDHAVTVSILLIESFSLTSVHLGFGDNAVAVCVEMVKPTSRFAFIGEDGRCDGNQHRYTESKGALHVISPKQREAGGEFYQLYAEIYPTIPRISRADEITAKPDIQFLMSGFRGKADVPQRDCFGLLLAKNRH